MCPLPREKKKAIIAVETMKKMALPPITLIKYVFCDITTNSDEYFSRRDITFERFIS
ncbi:hypothetical protein D881_10985 [Corynebacterium ulcerans NCTC 12077]|nr:hypothetical protein D881_10985 [Corynebacterium ulcerans NCTC 12077]